MRRWIVVGVVGVVAVAVAAGAWTAAAEPITFGSMAAPGPGPLLLHAGAPDPAVDDEHLSIFTYDYQPGATFAALLSIRNDGPMPITIFGTGDPKRERMFYGFSRRDFALVPPGDGGATDPATLPALTELSIPPGEELQLWARYRITERCLEGRLPYVAGSSVGTDRLHIDWQLLGLPRSTDLTMPVMIQAANEGPDTPACPAAA